MYRVFISSTSIDLPVHREKVREACTNQECFPDGMETWPAQGEAAEAVCLSKVDQAELFIGIYGYRYGWVPPNRDKSITELEYERAVQNGIPRLVFLMDDDHPVMGRDVEVGPGAEALATFKTRLQGENIRRTFRNADHLRAEVVNALAFTLKGLQRSSSKATPESTSANLVAPRIDLGHLPSGATHFLGRHDELKALDCAWSESLGTHIVQLIAVGGTGKTSLASRWLDRLQADGWRGAHSVFGWSFYNQGSGENQEASEDEFFEAALKFFDVRIEPTASAWEKGAALANAVAAQRNLLVLDGLEPLQFPPTAVGLAGDLKTLGVQTMLKQLARCGQPGLVVVTSREHLSDLADRVRDTDRPDAGVVLLDLSNFSDADGARLLYRLGVTWAGGAQIKHDAAAEDMELQAASREISGHALSLNVLGSYLARAKGGDVRRISEVNFTRANDRTNKGQAFHAMAAYESWYQREGPEGARELAVLRLLGLFDRPATRANLAALRAHPVISGLTEALVDLDEEDWNLALANLAQIGLASFNYASGSLAAHPLVREYFADRTEARYPDAWREAHRRIYQQLTSDTPHRPDGLSGLQPLYQAVTHGCRAGLYDEVLEKVYLDRILRGMGNDGFYSIKKLGTFGADLSAIAGFFINRWWQPVKGLSDENTAKVFIGASHFLRRLGRLVDALEPMRAGAELAVQRSDWRNAAIAYGNLSELRLSLGQIAEAVDDATLSIDYAKRSRDSALVLVQWTLLARAKHQQGQDGDAMLGYTTAESMQAERDVNWPLLDSRRGFRYCDFLLAEVERAAWQGKSNIEALNACAVVAMRAARTLSKAIHSNWLMDIALDRLTLARCALYADLIRALPPGETAQRECEAALNGLRTASDQMYLPRGLLTRAWLRHALDDVSGADDDLKEAQQIAERGGMKLFLADIALTRTRLFKDQVALARARELIAECGYGRRLPELRDLEVSITGSK